VTEVIDMTHPPASLVDDLGEPRMDKSLALGKGPSTLPFNYLWG
jgi:hypothetical protein